MRSRYAQVITQTVLDFTGQYKDFSGLVFLNARYYDPVLGRFISADSIVPGASGGVIGQDDGKLTPLTVDFHEPAFASTVGEENRLVLGKDFLDEETVHTGPSNPQALNRYAYVMNNPLKYTDPTGHCPVCRYAGPIIRGVQGFGRWLARMANRVGPAAGQVAPASSRAVAASSRAGEAAKKAQEGTTRLYRAVSEAEYQQLMKTGKFQSTPTSMEGKWFAESAADAARWGEQFGGKFRTIAIDLPNEIAQLLYRVEKLDNIGPARYAEIEQLLQAIVREAVK